MNGVAGGRSSKATPRGNVTVGLSPCHINSYLPNSFILNIIGHTHNDGESPVQRVSQRVRPRLEGAYSRAEGSRFPSARKNIAGWQFRRQPPIQGRETERAFLFQARWYREAAASPLRGAGCFFAKRRGRTARRRSARTRVRQRFSSVFFPRSWRAPSVPMDRQQMLCGKGIQSGQQTFRREVSEFSGGSLKR